MKRQFLHIASALAFTALFLTGCKDDTGSSGGEYGAGTYVINEGGFSANNASISYIDASGEVHNDIYSLENDGVLLGDVAQSMLVYNGSTYIVVNNSSKIVKVNSETFEHQSVLGSLEMPRHMVIHNGSIYLTQWVGFGVSGKVSVIDPASLTIIDEIPAGIAPEKMLVKGNRLFVVNSNDSSMTVINTSGNEVDTTVAVGDWPAGIYEGADGNLWILCMGVPSWAGTATSGELVVIDPDDYSVVKQMDFGSTSANPNYFASDANGGNMFCYFNGGVYRIENSAAALPAPLFQAPAGIYGLGVHPATGNIYVADAGNFSSNGWVYTYSQGGQAIDSVQVGVAPNGFYFHQ